MKKWERPKLIVLVKGKPDEAVLTACKDVYFDVGPADDGSCGDFTNCAIISSS